MDMTLTQIWQDDRLLFAEEWFGKQDCLILPLELIDQIWNPRPFVVNAKSTDLGQLVQKLVSVYVFRNHTVQYTVNVFTTVACSMNYRYYPYDSQLCPMFLESFSFDETQVQYLWASTEAFTINPHLRMLQFQPRRPLHFSSASVSRYNEERNFSQLIAFFRFDRLLGNHLIQTFAPCSLVVCLSWFSFWLELNALSARMSLLVTSILTLVTQFAGLKSDLPPVAYIKAVDIWMAGCMIWVFGALGEFVLAKVIYSTTEDAKYDYHEDHIQLFEQTSKNKKLEANSEMADNITTNQNADGITVVGFVESGGNSVDKTPPRIRKRRFPSLNHKESFTSIATTSSASLEKNVGKLRIPLQWTHPKTGKTILLWKRIDNISKWIFPLTFVIFCTIYWLTLYIHAVAWIDIDNVVGNNGSTTVLA